LNNFLFLVGLEGFGRKRSINRHDQPTVRMQNSGSGHFSSTSSSHVPVDTIFWYWEYYAGNDGICNLLTH